MAWVSLREKRNPVGMRMIPETEEDMMVVKSLSVPPGLEALMEGLTREVLKHQPKDICAFAANHFEELLKTRENSERKFQIIIIKQEYKF